MNKDAAIRRIQEIEAEIAACAACVGLGVVKPYVTNVNDPRFGQFVPCPDCAELLRERHDLRCVLVFADAVAHYTALRSDLLTKTFANYDAQGPQAEAYNAVLRWTRSEIAWTYVYGPTGNGKTHLAAAACNALVAAGRIVLFATAPDMLALIKEGFDSGTAEGLLNLCQRVPWLVLDDLGTEQVTAWNTEAMFRLFNARYVTRAHTLVAANHRPEELPSERVASRLRDVGLCAVVANSAPDYRLRAGGDR